jgi:hypothetical protein
MRQFSAHSRNPRQRARNRPLENQPQAELYVARIRADQNLAELRRIHRHARGVPEAELRRVEHVVELGPELRIKSLADSLTAKREMSSSSFLDREGWVE